MNIEPIINAGHAAILGKTGSGKTYTAKGIAERLLKAGKRVCVLDPTGAWWGLRSNVKGDKPAFPIVVFGGNHADVALNAGSGQAIAEIIGTTDTSAVLDTRDMSVGERSRFFTDFGETLLRRNKGPLHLIIDEAHVFMPQGRVPDPQSGRMLHAGNNLVSLGRGVGLRIIMITQRPAKLHKDSLTQAESLIALRLIAPQDRRAVEDWIGEWAEPKQGAELLASLPSLPTGTGWVWAPEQGVLDKVTFPKITTYDSSKAPDGEQGQIVLASIDLPAIQARLETVAKEAIENDPKRLRARIAELEKAKGGKVDHRALKAAEDAAYLRGQAAGFDHGFEAGYDRALEVLTEGRTKKPARTPAPSRPAPVGSPVKPKAAHIQHDGISGPQQRILDAIAKLDSLGVAQIKKGQTAAFAGASPKSSAFTNNLGRLRTMKLIDYPRSGEVCLTAEGKAAAIYPETPATVGDLHSAWLRLLSGPQARIVECIIVEYPKSLTKTDVADRVGVSATSSAFTNNLGALRSLGLLDYPEKGLVQATDVLFPR